MPCRENENDYIKDAIVTYDKMSTLIHELLVVDVWRVHVFRAHVLPAVTAGLFSPRSTIPIYCILETEAIICTLLETCMFYGEVTECVGERAVDLTDYCVGKVITLVDTDAGRDGDMDLHGVARHENEEISRELIRQHDELQFQISIKCITLLRYIIDHYQRLPVGVARRLLVTHDVPVLLVTLLQRRPWCRVGGSQQYVDNRWQEQPDRNKVNKVEAQVWFSVYQLLMTGELRQMYDINHYRKGILLKVQSDVMSEVLVDQLPFLADLARYLHHLSVTEQPPSASSATTSLIIEQCAELRDHVMSEYQHPRGTGGGDRWAELADTHMRTVLNPHPRDMQARTVSLATLYQGAALEELLCESAKCAWCGQQPTQKRCGKCKNEWYCERECQVKHWKKHKQACDILATSTLG